MTFFLLQTEMAIQSKIEKLNLFIITRKSIFILEMYILVHFYDLFAHEYQNTKCRTTHIPPWLLGSNRVLDKNVINMDREPVIKMCIL